MSDDKDLDHELLLAEVEDRLEDLKYEYGEDELSEVKVNQKIRDEFKDEKYKKVLEELGVNKADTGLKKIENTTSSNLLKSDDRNIDTLVKILLNSDEYVEQMMYLIRGFELDVNKKWKLKTYVPIPRDIRTKINTFLKGIWKPQNIVSNKQLSLTVFESRLNHQVQSIRIMLENVPDHIVPPGKIKYVVDILLGEVAVMINAIENGNLGKIATDMVTGSYNERSEPPKDLNRDEILKALSKN